MKKSSVLILSITVILTAVFYLYFGWGLPAVKRFPIEATTTWKTTSDAPLYTEETVADTLRKYPLTKAMLTTKSVETLPVIPGIEATRSLDMVNDEIDMCTEMTPQGVAVAEDYLIISAYDHDKRHFSVLYIQSLQTKKLLKTVILPGKPHVGGITYDSDNQQLWLCGRKNKQAAIFTISLKALKAYKKESMRPIRYSQEAILGTINRASYLTYQDKSLFVGFFNPWGRGVIQRYQVDNKGQLQGKNPIKQVANQFQVFADAVARQDTIKQIQGLTFAEGYGILSQSFGPKGSKLYIFKEDKTRKIYHESHALAVFSMPAHLEQVTAANGQLYLTFESAAAAYRKTSSSHIDRILILDLKTLTDLIKEETHEKTN